jgi:hypothetical protein
MDEMDSPVLLFHCALSLPTLNRCLCQFGEWSRVVTPLTSNSNDEQGYDLNQRVYCESARPFDKATTSPHASICSSLDDAECCAVTAPSSTPC